MDEAESQPPNGLFPNGLLPNEAASVMRVLDSARWSKAEERTAELIGCIKPNEQSENQRNAVACYVQRLIMKCFPCQVFTFGSVPLKTYLPDGDIDLTAFSKNQDLKDTWAHKVRDMLENEEKNENAEFQVKEVHYIQAEVKIIKCLVENIVVDISFNQLGGLCTLCFLEEVDHMIKGDHLFKRSIILVKAWCYYESRILGAHHGLISTYALETLVLYIFHVFNKSFAGPLEVLYRFLEFFSKFDWDNFCVSLWGPVPIGSLPNVTAEPPRKDGGKLLLAKSFLDACGSVYAVFPNGQESNGLPFVSKHFNVIDPLRVNNNLGRSVSKGNFFRIRSAFALGAKKLARLLECDSANIHFEVNQFFQNTWERHGSGHRPDAPLNGFWQLRPPNYDYLLGSENENLRNIMSSKYASREGQNDSLHGPCIVQYQHGNHALESTSWSGDVGTESRTESQKININYSLRTSDQARREISSDHRVNAEKSVRSSKPDSLVSDLQGRYLFARTRSSPELTDTYNEVSSRARHTKAPENAKGQTAAARLDNIKRQYAENLSSHTVESLADDLSSLRRGSPHQSPHAAEFSSYHDESALGATGEEFASVLGTQEMHQVEQDLVNMMASSSALGFNGQVHLPLNLASGHLSFPISPSALASMGYLPRNLSAMLSTNIPLESPWGANMQIPQGLVSSPLTHYFPTVGLTSSQEGSVEHSNESFGTVELNPGDADNDLWPENERLSNGCHELDNGSLEMDPSDDKQQSTSGRYKFGPSRVDGSGNSSRVQKFTRGSRGDHAENFLYTENKGVEVLCDERFASSSLFPIVPSNSVGSRASSESSWDESSGKTKSPREKRGRKSSTPVPSVVQEKGKGICESSSSQVDDDCKERSSLLSTSPEIVERGLGPPSTDVSRHPVPGFELAQTSESDPVVPIPPVILGHGARFYPTGPPVPFVTMLPIYNFPAAETGTSVASTSQFGSEEGMDNFDPCQNGDSLEGHHDQSEVPSPSTSMRVSASLVPFEYKSDILNSDFASHWQNLQYGRFCQNPQPPTPVICPPSVFIPPVYLQGRIPWEGPGRPVSPNMNLLSQLMGYGPRILPVAPLQAASSRPAGVYQHYVDEVPRYRGGTGTYLPNPKVSVRDRHTSNSSRKANYNNYDRSEHHGEHREGSWNNSKSRAPGRNHNRNPADKSSSSRPDRLAGTSESSRLERTWVSHRHDNPTSYQQSQNGPDRANVGQIGSPNIGYSMYPLTSMNPGAFASNGPLVMFYPYDHNAGGGGGSYGSPAGQIEFGSLGPVGFAEPSHVNEDQRFHSSAAAAAQLSSPDQPSSPHLQR